MSNHKLSMTNKAKARRRRWIARNAEKQKQLYRTTKPLVWGEMVFGFGGHSKGRTVRVQPKNQSQWRKKLRRMGKKRADKFLKASGYRR